MSGNGFRIPFVCLSWLGMMGVAVGFALFALTMVTFPNRTGKLHVKMVPTRLVNVRGGQVLTRRETK